MVKWWNKLDVPTLSWFAGILNHQHHFFACMSSRKGGLNGEWNGIDTKDYITLLTWENGPHKHPNDSDCWRGSHGGY